MIRDVPFFLIECEVEIMMQSITFEKITVPYRKR
jgi:hypothetical protein